MGKAIDIYQTYDKFFLIGDFSAEDTEPCLSQFLFEYDAKKFLSEITCFKSIDNRSSINLFITNSPNSFQNTSSKKIFLKVLGRHAPIKNKTVRANHGTYVTKTMRKAIMKRIDLQHRYFKITSSENLKLFKWQINF